MLDGDPAARVVALTNREFWLPTVSATFHGRDILAPVAAHLSLGTALDDLGEAWDQPVQLSWPQVAVEKQRLQGEIIAIDTFGNLITNIPQDLVAAAGAANSATVHCGGRTISGIVATYGQRRPGTLVALVGSSNRLEIAVVNGNAAVELRAEVGDAVSVVLPG